MLFRSNGEPITTNRRRIVKSWPRTVTFLPSRSVYFGFDLQTASSQSLLSTLSASCGLAELNCVPITPNRHRIVKSWPRTVTFLPSKPVYFGLDLRTASSQAALGTLSASWGLAELDGVPVTSNRRCIVKRSPKSVTFLPSKSVYFGFVFRTASNQAVLGTLSASWGLAELNGVPITTNGRRILITRPKPATFQVLPSKPVYFCQWFDFRTASDQAALGTLSASWGLAELNGVPITTNRRRIVKRSPKSITFLPSKSVYFGFDLQTASSQSLLSTLSASYGLAELNCVPITPNRQIGRAHV